ECGGGIVFRRAEVGAMPEPLAVGIVPGEPRVEDIGTRGEEAAGAVGDERRGAVVGGRAELVQPELSLPEDRPRCEHSSAERCNGTGAVVHDAAPDSGP